MRMQNAKQDKVSAYERATCAPAFAGLASARDRRRDACFAVGSDRGFTLIELLVVVVVVAVLLALSAPAFISTINENETRTQALRLASSLNLARSSAARENVRVGVCPTADAATCSNDESDFRIGWLVYADRDDNNTLTAGSDELIQVFQGLPRGYSVKLKNAATRVNFFPDGSTSGAEILTTCPPGNDDSRAWSVVVRAVGSPRLSRPAAGALCS